MANAQKKTLVVFLQSGRHSGYNANEMAGFDGDFAAKLIDAGAARAADPKHPADAEQFARAERRAGARARRSVRDAEDAALKEQANRAALEAEVAKATKGKGKPKAEETTDDTGTGEGEGDGDKTPEAGDGPGKPDGAKTDEKGDDKTGDVETAIARRRNSNKPS